MRGKIPTVDPEAIRLSCSVMQLARICPELHLTPFLHLYLSFFLPFIAPTSCRHTTAFWISDGAQPNSACGQHLAFGWPLAVDSQGRGRTQDPLLSHPKPWPLSLLPPLFHWADKSGAVWGLGGRLSLTCVTRCPLSHSAGG